MNPLYWHPQGRFGNTCMQYLFARALAEREGLELHIAGGEWVGEKIFDVQHPHRDFTGECIATTNEAGLLELASSTLGPLRSIAYSGAVSGHGTRLLHYRGYAQHQGAMIYTKREAQAWLSLRTEFVTWININYPFVDLIHCHRRAGDYIGYGYPVVSMASYAQALNRFQWHENDVEYCTEEVPFRPEQFPWAPFLPDFLRLVHAPVILRGNSTFSWIVGLLSNGIVLSPVIDGLQGGMEHHCEFVVGNHPRLANLDFTTDLYVNP